MRPLVPFLACFLLASSLTGAADADAAREEALDNLLSERDSAEALTELVGKARAAGVSEQAILEARFLYHVDRREDAAIAAMLPEFVRRKDGFRLEDSAIFAVKEDWLAVVEYVHAIERAQKDDRDGFKKHITEAFWLSPRQAAAFAPHIERMRLAERMSEVSVDFSSRLLRLDGGDAVALADLLRGRKAMLFHFWSPWSQDCVDLMPDFTTLAASLKSSGIAVVSLVPAAPAKMVEEARDMIAKPGGKAPGAWVIDRKEDPFNAMFRVQNYPRMVIVSAGGKVIFNGEPGDQAFWQKLLEIEPDLRRPDSPLRDKE